MKKEKYEDFEPEGELVQVHDFLPPPHVLFPKAKPTVKVTLALTKESVAYFKKAAKAKHTKYQKMIRELVHRYSVGR
jgi:predicted DNA binding CopG/RHH family protein